MHQGLAALRMRGHHHPGRLLMHLAQTTIMHQGLTTTTTTTVLLMHRSLEEMEMGTISTMLQSLTRTRSQVEVILSVGRKDTLLVSALARILLQLSPLQP